MNDKLLTIAIPTYNGSETIERTICSILNQLDEYPVEVLVSDNCSNDDTAKIVEKYSRVKYFGNDENLGADRNISLCVERAKSEYVLILGDDDIVKEGGLKEIIYLLEEQKPAALFLNYQLHDVESKKILKERWVDISENKVCDNGADFLDLTGVSANFLSSIVHSKSLYIATNYEKYIGTNWVQFGTLLEYISDRKVACVAEPIIENQGVSITGEGNAGGRSIPIMLNMIKIINGMDDDVYDENLKRKLISEVRKYFLRKLFSSKRLGLKVDLKLLLKLYHAFPVSWRTFLLELPSLLLPKCFHHGVYKIYKSKYIYTMYWKIKSFR